MANQLDLQQVLYIDGSPLKMSAHKSVLTSDILVYEIDNPVYSGASTVIQWYSNTSNQLAYTSLYCADSFNTIMGLAGTSLVQVSVLEINQNPIPAPRLYAFPVNGIGIQEAGMGVSTITFKGNTYLVSGNINDLIDNSNIGGYKVYTALLTQNGGDAPSYIVGDENIYKGITYEITINDANFDFTEFGSPNNTVGTFFVSTKDGVIVTSGDIRLDYNTGAPVVTVLENTIGNVWFTYYVGGDYNINSNGLFINEKTFALIGTTDFTGGGDSGASITLPAPPNMMEILALNGDNALQNTPIEIRVYS